MKLGWLTENMIKFSYFIYLKSKTFFYSIMIWYHKRKNDKLIDKRKILIEKIQNLMKKSIMVLKNERLEVTYF